MTSRTMLLLAGAGAAAFPAAASAATTPVGGGVIVIKPVRAFEARLAHSGTHLAALGPAGYRAGVYTLAVASGNFSFAGGGGTVADRGSLRLRHGQRVVMITGVKFTLGATSKVSAVVAGRRMALFDVSRRRSRAVSGSMGRIIAGLRLMFSRRAAARVDALLGSNVLNSRRVAAIAAVIVEAKPSAAGLPSTPGSPTVSGPSSGGPGGQPSSGTTNPSGILGQIGIPGLPPIAGLPAIPGLPLPGLPNLPTAPALP